jgi:ubiquinone/menaquinone biosynthesis C-methylase UbiE
LAEKPEAADLTVRDSVKTEWDYSSLADAYLSRPDYSEAVIQSLLGVCFPSDTGEICDIGAGTGHLTKLLAVHDHDVIAVEPNDRMRAHGNQITESFRNVRWLEGTAESTGLASSSVDLVTFGSSFNVCDQSAALQESVRILRPSGWFACMWNHRVLEDSLQSEIESVIKSQIKEYDYGSRRQDPTDVIDRSGFFGEVHHISGTVTHTQTVEECATAWRSHATLQRQSGGKFEKVVAEIEKVLNSGGRWVVDVPYVTRIWFAQRDATRG